MEAGSVLQQQSEVIIEVLKVKALQIREEKLHHQGGTRRRTAAPPPPDLLTLRDGGVEVC